MTQFTSEMRIIDQLKEWLQSEKKNYDEELSRITKFAPHLHDKPLCLATDSAMCGIFLDKIEELQIADLLRGDTK